MENQNNTPVNPLREIIDPFINLFKAPRALWGINLSYVIEGLTYFGVLGLLAIYFNDISALMISMRDSWSEYLPGVSPLQC